MYSQCFLAIKEEKETECDKIESIATDQKRNFWERLLPHRKGDAFPTPGRRQCAHKLHHGLGCFLGNFPRLGEVTDRERISLRMTPDQSEKLIVFRKRILSSNTEVNRREI
ncbi:hypothetical protein TNCV_1817921 [Trichonephila clavipes]|nr:hypothetical protein TNCV_1817921 [Trichonephila clavipes]